MVLLLLPALVLFLQERVRFIKWLSPIVVCYIIGIVAGNLPFVTPDNKLLRSVAEVSVCLATPMLLFSCDFLKWLRNSRASFLSFFFGMLAVVILSFIAFVVFHDRIYEAWKVSGMAVGLYTGATVNLTAIGIALDADEKTFIVMNSADLLFGGIYFFFLITLGKKTIGLFLPGFKGYNDQIACAGKNIEQEPKTPLKKMATAEIALSLALSVAILAFAFGLSMLFTKGASSTLIILIITTCGIILSFNKKINRLKYNYATGDYLLLVFALALGSMANYNELVSGNLYLVLFVAIVVFGSVMLHLLFSYFFRLEDDTVIITSAAVIFGPAFILPVAGAIKNREVIVAGLSLALLGNALGTYLGIGLAYLLNYLF